MSRRGFTLIEITVALIVGGMALGAAAALLTGLSTRADQIRDAGRRVDSDGNAERLLRSVFENLRFSGDTTHTVSGSSTSVTVLSWCETVEGWLRPCRAQIGADSSGSGLQLTLALPEYTQAIVLPRGDSGHVAIRYLLEVDNAGRWITSWNEIVAPTAIELIRGADTLLLPTW